MADSVIEAAINDTPVTSGYQSVFKLTTRKGGAAVTSRRQNNLPGWRNG